MFKKEFIGIGLCVLVAGLLVLPACYFFSSQQPGSQDVLTMGTNPFPPYESRNDKGEWEGFDIDVATIIAQKLGKKLVIKDMSFDALILSLKQGKIDMIIAGMSITPTRQAAITMIHYHGKPFASYPLVFWKKIPAGVKTIYDLKNLPNNTVCVPAGYIQADFLEKFDFINVKKIGEISDLIMDIKFGKSIACLLEPFVIAQIKKQHPEIQVLAVPLDKKDKTFGHGIGIAKENTHLASKIQKIIDDLKKDGTLKSLVDKWEMK